jgi:hypothetical protein
VFRLATENGSGGADAPDPTAGAAGQVEPAAMGELRDLVDRARRGDESAMPALRTIFDERPEIVTWLGDLAVHAEEALLHLACGQDLGLAEAIRRRSAALKLELVGPSPTTIERLLAERVAITWVHLYWSEATAAQAMGVETNSTRQVAFCLERLDRAQRRHLAALGALATAQRLLSAAKVPSGPAIAKNAVAASGGTTEGMTVGSDRDGHTADRVAQEPDDLNVFAGPESVASPAIGAPGRRGRRRRPAI